jgi:hypothetical protein
MVLHAGDAFLWMTPSLEGIEKKIAFITHSNDVEIFLMVLRLSINEGKLSQMKDELR